jgi:hypothetical protein
MVKRYMYVCFGILALVVALNRGGGPVSATAKPTPVGISAPNEHGRVFVVMSNGDTYYTMKIIGHDHIRFEWDYIGNIRDVKQTVDELSQGSIPSASMSTC